MILVPFDMAEIGLCEIAVHRSATFPIDRAAVASYYGIGQPITKSSRCPALPSLLHCLNNTCRDEQLKVVDLHHRQLDAHEAGMRSQFRRAMGMRGIENDLQRIEPG